MVILVRSVIPSNLIESYLATEYQIDSIPKIALHINEHSESLARLFSTSQLACAAIISAYNPFSQLQSNDKNLIEHELLHKHLSGYPYKIIESYNIDPIQSWPLEKSFFVLGLDLNTARILGQQFNQNAIVWIEADAIPQLILLR